MNFWPHHIIFLLVYETVREAAASDFLGPLTRPQREWETEWVWRTSFQIPRGTSPRRVRSGNDSVLSLLRGLVTCEDEPVVLVLCQCNVSEKTKCELARCVVGFLRIDKVYSLAFISRISLDSVPPPSLGEMGILGFPRGRTCRIRSQPPTDEAQIRQHLPLST